MKNLLNDAVNEIMFKVLKEMDEAKQEMQVAETIGRKVQIVNEHKAIVLKLFNKLDFLEMQAIMKFDDKDKNEVIDRIRRFKYNAVIQIEDAYRIAGELA